MTTLSTKSSWNVKGDQSHYMTSDLCILVNESDEVLGSANKYETHKWENISKKNLLHRAFSVFLFNEDNKLLLQQRSLEKITFPGVWTNTCCSHPLHCPEELEIKDALGVKRAAIRKLNHELGIDASQIPIENIKFLTRLYYKAPCEVEGGGEPTWGEHEVDHILFFKGTVDVKANPEEVMDTKYVDASELREMLSDSKNIWSPWFRKIEEKLLPPWWVDVDKTMASKDFVDNIIHRL